eukprot:c39082_g1_i1.p1 GENE.c39082_g1_i1~~c39082_g1_i1.p1  ORF type:complete len:346 (+),score=102.08 c39082_g1_i1:44-1039(+)
MIRPLALALLTATSFGLPTTTSLLPELESVPQSFPYIVRIEHDPNEEEVPVNVDSPFKPVVQMHGMGDFAANPLGMVPLKRAISKQLNGTYVTNIALGSNVLSDMLGSFVEVMDKEVDIFAAAVRADVNLKDGFNAIGYSQGALTIRGYIEKYNDPPVHSFISMHGILAGVAGFPHCNFTSEICEMFDNFLGAAAYNSLSQSVLAQANYLRDPLRIDGFLKNCHFLPDVNNERNSNATFTKHFQNITRLVMVKALEDTMVWPNDSEWFGFYQDGSDKIKLQMEDTEWYKQDLFGLRTLDEAGRIVKLTTPGDHLQFTEQFLLDLVDSYFKA